MNKFIKEIIVLVLLFNPLLSMASKEIEEIPVLPKKSWDELVGQLGPYTLTAKELSVVDCPQVITDEKKIAGSAQHIMFNDYMWDVYLLADGNRCVNIIKPELGLLTEYEARVLLSASQGYGFEESGLSQEVQKFVIYQEDQMVECEENDKKMADENTTGYDENWMIKAYEESTRNSVPLTEEELEMIESHSIDESFKLNHDQDVVYSEKFISTPEVGCFVKNRNIE